LDQQNVRPAPVSDVTTSEEPLSELPNPVEQISELPDSESTSTDLELPVLDAPVSEPIDSVSETTDSESDLLAFDIILYIPSFQRVNTSNFTYSVIRKGNWCRMW
jgi:hypothetical protein